MAGSYVSAYNIKEVIMSIRLSVGWAENSLTGGDDDPHKGTAFEGKYAGLLIKAGGKEYFLRCSDWEYTSNLPRILEGIVKEVNKDGV